MFTAVSRPEQMAREALAGRPSGAYAQSDDAEPTRDEADGLPG
ncbi:hypothetical protein AKJ09_03178 [Labilithrix luteola]|uniref:Uncharacterized protein n=1 Tax=Labilithrix luteola TaxID=1391654 RepID=A0A0K1PTQ4_9BACT|nr:hypothetical protein AKJ09_03178 [Labilithrix luteola]